MYDKSDKNISDEEKLNKFIEQKTNENEALKKLLEKLKEDNDLETKKVTK
jgi:flagellar biosynthesis/type III secretory pathway ATPase